MLILTRYEKETFVIGDNAEVEVTVLAIKGNQVKIGIEAPRSITVNRQEVHRQMKRMN